MGGTETKKFLVCGHDTAKYGAFSSKLYIFSPFALQVMIDLNGVEWWESHLGKWMIITKGQLTVAGYQQNTLETDDL